MYSQISILRHHIYKATEHGADFNELCRRMKINPTQLSDGEGHMDYKPSTDGDFWTHALALTGDPCLGLHMGERPDHYNAFGLLGMLAGSCRTIGEALQMICKYNDTLTAAFTFSYTENADHAKLMFNPHPMWEETNLESARQATDTFLAGVLTSIRQSGSRRIDPMRIELRYDRRFVDEYQRISQCPVLFNKDSNLYVFRKTDMDVVLLNHDLSLFISFNNLLFEKQKKLASQQTLSGKIRHLLLTEFNGQAGAVDLVASRLCMTTRTLQRKLTEEKTSYREICNELRRELAEDLIQSGKTTKMQVATLFGYSDTSSFNKAFRGWQGK